MVLYILIDILKWAACITNEIVKCINTMFITTALKLIYKFYNSGAANLFHTPKKKALNFKADEMCRKYFSFLMQRIH